MACLNDTEIVLSFATRRNLLSVRIILGCVCFIFSMCSGRNFTAQVAAQKEQRTGRSYDTVSPGPKPSRPGPQGQSAVVFSDITTQTGIDFRQSGSPTSRKYLLETMGSGVALFEYDNDGRLDIFFANGAAITDPMPDGARPDKNE